MYYDFNEVRAINAPRCQKKTYRMASWEPLFGGGDSMNRCRALVLAVRPTSSELGQPLSAWRGLLLASTSVSGVAATPFELLR